MSLAFARALEKEMTANVAKTPMIAITTKSSMSVNPFFFMRLFYRIRLMPDRRFVFVMRLLPILHQSLIIPSLRRTDEQVFSEHKPSETKEGGYRSGQTGQTVNLLALCLRRFEPFPTHQKYPTDNQWDIFISWPSRTPKRTRADIPRGISARGEAV